MRDYYTLYRKYEEKSNTSDNSSNIDKLNALLKELGHNEVSIGNWKGGDRKRLSKVSKELRHRGKLEAACDIDALKNEISKEIRDTATATGSRQKPS